MNRFLRNLVVGRVLRIELGKSVGIGSVESFNPRLNEFAWFHAL